MKHFFACILLSVCLQATEQPKKNISSHSIPTVQNLFIITIDGFRWQEVFTGADSALINDENVCPDTATVKMMFWANTAEERRKKLLPFFWNVLSCKGQIYGNRNLGNKMNVSNIYSISYSGYNEMFTGHQDLSIATNDKSYNSNINVLEYLNNKTAFVDSVVAFTSWDVFPFILNRKRSKIKLNSGYETIENNDSDENISLINHVQNDAIINKTQTRHDELTFVIAKEYISEHKPRIVYLGFGETDELAHQGRYDLYLQKAARIDQMIAELWHLVQSTPGYKNNTTFIITTDHGRGNKKDTWSKHGFFVKGSSQTWLVLMGPNIKPLGEMKNDNQIFQEQIAQTIANLVGEDFRSNHTVASAISW
jgi:hypothetical protein